MKELEELPYLATPGNGDRAAELSHSGAANDRLLQCLESAFGWAVPSTMLQQLWNSQLNPRAGVRRESAFPAEAGVRLGVCSQSITLNRKLAEAIDAVITRRYARIEVLETWKQGS